MMYLNSVSALNDSGVLPFEIILRLLASIAVAMAVRRGYWVWLLGVAIVAFPAEIMGSSDGGYCKAESFLMWAECSEISLHVSFWMFWTLPACLAVQRLAIRPFARPFAVGIIATCSGVPFDLAGPIVHWWHFIAGSGDWEKMINHWMLLQSSGFPMAWAQHLWVGIGVATCLELVIWLSGPVKRDEFGYPIIAGYQQLLIGMCGPIVGYAGGFASTGITWKGFGLLPAYWYVVLLGIALLVVLWGSLTYSGLPPQFNSSDVTWCIPPIGFGAFCLAESLRAHFGLFAASGFASKIAVKKPDKEIPLEDVNVWNSIYFMAAMLVVQCVALCCAFCASGQAGHSKAKKHQ